MREIGACSSSLFMFVRCNLSHVLWSSYPDPFTYARICEDAWFLSTCTDVIVATYQENSTFTLWRVLSRFPLHQSPLVCWKMCFVVHRVLRDGPKKVGCVTHTFPFATTQLVTLHTYRQVLTVYVRQSNYNGLY